MKYLLFSLLAFLAGSLSNFALSPWDNIFILLFSFPLLFLIFQNVSGTKKNKKRILSFIFFRFFDILKPFPVSYFDKNHKNYFGIIMDDIMAGLYSMILIYLISLKF